MIRFLRLVSSLCVAASIVCFAISAASFAVRPALADEEVQAGPCGPYEDGWCQNAQKCISPNYCTQHASCPCTDDQ
jgi:hypothetical protein